MMRRAFATNKLPGKPAIKIPIRQGVKADPEPLPESAGELWTRQQLGLPYVPDKPGQAAYYSHPLYTPPALPRTGLGPLIKPLHFPTLDQKCPPRQISGFSNSWVQYEFDDPKNAPIGDYPRNIPQQWTQLKDPFGYWDQQGRRNFGEILQDHDQFTDWLSPGPNEGVRRPLLNMLGVFGVFALLSFSVTYWNPANHRLWVERKFPHSGLRVELGGDPDDEKDDWMSANGYHK